jgi:hypothetical protein
MMWIQISITPKKFPVHSQFYRYLAASTDFLGRLCRRFSIERDLDGGARPRSAAGIDKFGSD